MRSTGATVGWSATAVADLEMFIALKPIARANQVGSSRLTVTSSCDGSDPWVAVTATPSLPSVNPFAAANDCAALCAPARSPGR